MCILWESVFPGVHMDLLRPPSHYVVPPDQEDRILRALWATGRHTTQVRNHGAVELLFASGVDARELLACDCGDLEGDLLFVPTGDRAERRLLPVSRRAVDAFHALAADRARDRPLLEGRNPDGRLNLPPLAEAWRRALDMTGLWDKGRKPPLTATRATFAARLLANGVDEEPVRRLLGALPVAEHHLEDLREAVRRLDGANVSQNPR